jgi:hypothetical protein
MANMQLHSGDLTIEKQFWLNHLAKIVFFMHGLCGLLNNQNETL